MILLLSLSAWAGSLQSLSAPDPIRPETLRAVQARRTFEAADPLPFPLGEVVGFADLHTHQFAEEGFGQRVVLGGQPGGGSRWHGLRGSVSAVLALVPDLVNSPTAAALLRHTEEEADPSFDDWTHDQYTRDQLAQAHAGGLRLMGMFAVNQQLICAITEGYTGSTSWTCSDRVNIGRQIDAAWRFDAQEPWYQIALSPVAANHTMAAGGLAVMLGYESSDYLDHERRGGLIPHNNLLGNGWRGLEGAAGLHRHTDYTTEETQAEILVEVLRAQGMVTFIPVHHWNSAVGGAAFQQVSLLQPAYEMVANRGRLEHVSLARLGSGFGEFAWRHGNLTSWPMVAELATDPDMEGVRYMRNALGLTPLGKALYREAHAQGMFIDLSHLGDHGLDDALTALPEDTPVMLSHYTPRRTTLRHRDEREYQTAESVLRHIAAVDGVVGLRTAGERVRPSGGPVPNLCHGSVFSFAQMYDYSAHLGLLPALGTDMNGGASQTYPELGDYGCLAHTTPNDALVGRTLAANLLRPSPITPKSPRPGKPPPANGVRALGLAHVGLLPDLITEVHRAGLPTHGLWTSASASVDAWRRSAQRSPRVALDLSLVEPRAIPLLTDQDFDCLPDAYEEAVGMDPRSPNPNHLPTLLRPPLCATDPTAAVCQDLPVCATGTPDPTRAWAELLHRPNMAPEAVEEERAQGRTRRLLRRKGTP